MEFEVLEGKKKSLNGPSLVYLVLFRPKYLALKVQFIYVLDFLEVWILLNLCEFTEYWIFEYFKINIFMSSNFTFRKTSRSCTEKHFQSCLRINKILDFYVISQKVRNVL